MQQANDQVSYWQSLRHVWRINYQQQHPSVSHAIYAVQFSHTVKLSHCTVLCWCKMITSPHWQTSNTLNICTRYLVQGFTPAILSFSHWLMMQLTNAQHACMLVFVPESDILNILCDYQFPVFDELYASHHAWCSMWCSKSALQKHEMWCFTFTR